LDNTPVINSFLPVRKPMLVLQCVRVNRQILFWLLWVLYPQSAKFCRLN
jgi:hypothetical protein